MITAGKQIAEEILTGLRKEIENKKLNLRLAALLVGEDLEFKKFVELKGKVASKIGVGFEMYQFPENIETKKLKNELAKISEKSDGVLIELPLPKHIDQQAILNEIPVDKDVDVLSNEAQVLFYSDKSKVNPPAVEALKIVFDKYDIKPKDKKAAVFGQGILVGKPISYWLEQQGAEVYKINSKTENPEQFSKEADIVVAGVGKPGIIMGDMVKEGIIAIDFGYGKKDGRMLGDIDFTSVEPEASLITPVPGGMGPILIAVVLKNLVTLNSL